MRCHRMHTMRLKNNNNELRKTADTMRLHLVNCITFLKHWTFHSAFIYVFKTFKMLREQAQILSKIGKGQLTTKLFGILLFLFFIMLFYSWWIWEYLLFNSFISVYCLLVRYFPNIYYTSSWNGTILTMTIVNDSSKQF